MSMTNNSNIFKLSASLYSMNSSEYSQSDILLHIVKCNFINMDNKSMKYNEVIASVLENYQINITKDELTALLKQYAFCFVTEGEGEFANFSLTVEEEEKTRTNMEGGIDQYIDLYIDKLDNKEQAKSDIYTYLYKLTTSNINTYKSLLMKVQTESLNPSELAVDSKDFSEAAIKVIRGFLDWENEEKNRAISDIVMCCLEYCLCLAKYDTASLMKEFVENKTIYLDTNIIFRAIGINGPDRKKIIDAFLKKCKDANLKLVILDCTEKEFKDTIAYHIDKIYRNPRGEINSGLYLELSDYNIYVFYNEWSIGHRGLNLKYFKDYLISQFTTLVRKYGIKKEAFIQDKEDIFICENYVKKLGIIKHELSTKYSDIDSESLEQNAQIQHDAKLVWYVEKKRIKEGLSQSYIISSDKWLRYWVMQKAIGERAIVLFPSQFFLILIKLCGRAQDDLKSFVGFINIRHKTQQIPPSKANIILSAISSVTEDVQAQEGIVETILEKEFEGLVHEKIDDTELYQQVKQISENFLKEELTQREQEIALAMDENRKQKQEIQRLEDFKIHTEARVKEQDEKLYNLAKRATCRKFLFVWWGIPILLSITIFAYCLFIAAQFFWQDAKWNFIAGLIDWLNNTLFGENSGNASLYIVDCLLFGGIAFIVKKFMRNPFNKIKRTEYREKLIMKYLDN